MMIATRGILYKREYSWSEMTPGVQVHHGQPEEVPRGGRGGQRGQAGGVQTSSQLSSQLCHGLLQTLLRKT